MSNSSAVATAPKAETPVPNIALSQRSTWALTDASKLGCTHLDEWVGSSVAWEDSYTTVLKFANGLKLQRSAGKLMVKPPECFTCGEGSASAPLFASLQGVHIGCKKGKSGGCMAKHATDHKHYVAMDLARGEIFCFACQDVIYDARLEKVRRAFLDGVRDSSASGEGIAGSGAGNASGRGSAESYGVEAAIRCVPRRRDWIPAESSAKRLRESADSHASADAAVPAGLRGFHNVGNTCFLNCVLQGLVNNPGVRDYFLGDFHDRHRCQRRRELRGQAENVCMGCEADLLFNEMFQVGQRGAYTPHRFLYSMWKSSQHLAGYEQQDAHECFISLLDALQAACESNGNGDKPENNQLLRHLFTGRLRSDVTCLACKASSTTCEAFSDIPLDLRGGTSPPTISHAAATTPSSTSAAGNGSGGAARMWEKGPGDAAAQVAGASAAGDAGAGGAAVGAAARPAPSGVHLTECLHSFTRVERLEAHSYRCGACGANHPALKQLSVDALAPSLCFQLKRFETQRNPQTGGMQVASKIEDTVAFPLMLDMAPYLSPAVQRRGKLWADKLGSPNARGADDPAHSPRTQRPPPGADGEAAEAEKSPAWFELYAVVVHQGKMDSGHYTSYVRRGRDWFYCDDAAARTKARAARAACAPAELRAGRAA